MQSYYDKDRRLNTVKVDDGAGNLFVFNISPETKLTLKAILKQGELISFREGDKPFKRIDSINDQYSRRYQRLEPFKLTGAQEEFDLLAERRKKAPVPGEETQFAAPPEPEDSHPGISDSSSTPSPAAALEFFKGKQVFRDEKGSPYFPAEKTCSCGTVIPGRIHVSEMNGEFTRSQNFRADVIAQPSRKGSKSWECENCMPKSAVKAAKKAAKPAKKEKAVIKVSIPAEATESPSSELVETFHGNAQVKFERRRDGSFWYMGSKIVPYGNAYSVFRDAPCDKCSRPITFRSSVSFHDDKPWNVCGRRPFGQKAVLAGFKSQKWICEACATGKEQPAAPEQKATPTPSPEEVTLHDVVSAARAAGAHVSVDLVPREQPVPPAPAPDTPLTLFEGNPLAKLEEMAMDDSIDDRMFRGAAWMLARAVGGK